MMRQDPWILSRLISALLLVALLAACSVPSALPEESYRVEIIESGIYRLDFEDLLAAGLAVKALPSASLRLENAGVAVPIHVADGGDARFGPGDWIEFHGRRLSGSERHHHSFQIENVYWLSMQPGKHPRSIRHADGGASVDAAGAPLSRVHHLEQDRMMIRIANQDTFGEDDPELWYWAKMTHVDRNPVSIDFDLPDLHPDADQIELELRFRSLSQAPYNIDLGHMTHHQVDLVLNDTPLDSVNWYTKRPQSFVLPPLPASLLRAEGNTLQMRVPARIPPGQQAPLVDVVMFDYLRARYPARGAIEQPLISLDAEMNEASVVALHTRFGNDLVVVDDQGHRYLPRRVADEQGGYRHLFRPASSASTLHTGLRDALLRPEAVVRARGVDLREPAAQADYLMISHQRLADAAQPLAEFHRARGLNVAEIDIADVWENFGAGVVHPQALRDFIAYASEHWPKPAPRFVLLVGDASWDVRNADLEESRYADWAGLMGPLLLEGQFPDHGLPRYEPNPELAHRNLIPTWQFMSYEGHSAADNWFVATDPDSFLPQLAIGRIPVVDPEEVQAVVSKIIGYATDSEVGPWRRNALWITEDNALFRHISDALAGDLGGHGFAGSKVYPSEAEPDNALHQNRLVDAFNEGQLLVHFIGHGGRHIWRTGAPDPARNHDLFTLDHIEQLSNGSRLPVVLSMTCYSAPFDHPSVDSIGEKFLREPDRGAVAVLAASWRNVPTQNFSAAILNHLMDPQLSVGEAIMLAKQGQRDRTLVETYNLLGDPAMRLAIPSQTLSVQALPGEGVFQVQVSDAGFSGEGIAEWLDEKANVYGEARFQLRDGRGVVTIGPRPDQIGNAQLRVYAWNAQTRRDALGRWQPTEDQIADEPGQNAVELSTTGDETLSSVSPAR